ncbi:MAG: DNA repair protein RadA [Gammaproteobacteria bacterium]|nr:DNA repair protein RadA [Gammaproteobacteria bacterium]
MPNIKNKNIFTCQKCSAQFPKWIGQCPECGAWNSLVEESFNAPTTNPRFTGYADEASKITKLTDINVINESRILTNISELDRVLGNGLVTGSVVLVGGDPGVGKSTLLLQTLCNLSRQHECLYVTGEESLQQVALRAHRLGLQQDSLRMLAETNVETIINQTKKERPKVLVIDSIQTIYTNNIQSAPGGVGQVRESAAQLVRFAKQTGTSLFLVGHVTKDGSLAGPRVLEHMVDTVLYFEGERHNRYRIVRAIKNRFGAVNELGVFAMTDLGLKEVTNPSAIFLSRYTEPVAGSVVMTSWEGSRPLLVEVQALVDETHLGNPRRVTVGLEQNRIAMLLAVLHRHGGIPTYDQDVFANVVGGVKVLETAADLAILAAVVSSLKNHPLPPNLIVFGEVGLSGEIRPVQNGQERLKEAAKHGFRKAIIPQANAPKKPIPNMEIIAVKNLTNALQSL